MGKLIGLVLLGLLLLSAPAMAAPKDDAALLRTLDAIIKGRERLIRLARSSSHSQDGQVKLLRYLERDWPLVQSEVRTFRSAMDEIFEAPLRLFLLRRHLISQIVALQRWGRRTAVALPHPYKETMSEIRPILPGAVKIVEDTSNFPRNK